jgi:hypothetical protein
MIHLSKGLTNSTQMFHFTRPESAALVRPTGVSAAPAASYQRNNNQQE